MAIVCPVDLDTQALRSEIYKVYARLPPIPPATSTFTAGPFTPPSFSVTIRRSSPPYR